MRTGRWSRRDLGRLAGAAGVGAALGGSLGGGLVGGTAEAAARVWRTSGTAVTSLAPFDKAMKTFMTARNIPAGQLAVLRGGKLLLARGYTWSANSAFTLSPTSLFRIASLSKPVTATAVMRLVQDGKLSLSTSVSALLGLSTAADPRLANVTVTRLLQHLGGWDRDVSGDPMFADAAVAKAVGRSLPVGRADIIRYASGRKLDHKPGTTYAYSNYGYLLLGRIIEKVSGTSYASYVQKHVLGPMGITRMELGRTLPANRATGETRYYSQRTGTSVMDTSGTSVPAPYGAFNIENMDSHGGWLASAVDLARFSTVYDGTKVLSKTSIAKVFAKPEIGANADGSYYACGWQATHAGTSSAYNHWHNGSLDGTWTYLVRGSGGVGWAVLFDQRDDASGKNYADIDGALWSAANAVTSWPTTDRFPTYF